MPKFPFTNYHELNLDWILKKVETLFTASEENARTIRTYDTRLNSAEQTATSAATAATSAQQLADAAAANADNALSVAGTANAKADSALTAATNAAGAVSGALTIAQEAQQNAAAAVATANDAAATAAGLESLANTANQNATAAVETAGTAVTTANNAAAAAQTADQKAVAAQQTASTNAGNISTLQTNVTDLNRQISESITPAIEEIETALDGKAPVIVNTASGEIASFADGADDMPIRSLVVNIEPVQSGSGDPSPTNVRPITGHTECNIILFSKNILDRTADVNGYYMSQSGAITANANICYSGLIPVIKGKTYTFSGISANAAFKGVIGFDDSGNYISGLGATATQPAVGSSYSVTFVVPDNVTKIRITCGIADSNVQIEIGNTVTSFAEFKQGTTVYVSWQSAAGMVYGGTLDVISGLLTVSWAMVDLGALNWTKVASSNYKTFVGDLNTMRYVYNEKTVLSSAYVGTSGQAATESADNYVWVDSRNTIAIKDTSKADMSASEFKAAMSGIQLVYELATPITYQLTQQQLNTLLGSNNIWTDVGTVDVQYPADTKLYIDGKIAELQALVLEN